MLDFLSPVESSFKWIFNRKPCLENGWRDRIPCGRLLGKFSDSCFFSWIHWKREKANTLVTAEGAKHCGECMFPSSSWLKCQHFSAGVSRDWAAVLVLWKRPSCFCPRTWEATAALRGCSAPRSAPACRPKVQLGQHGRAHLPACGAWEPTTLTCSQKPGLSFPFCLQLSGSLKCILYMCTLGSAHVNKVFSVASASVTSPLT